MTKILKQFFYTFYAIFRVIRARGLVFRGGCLQVSPKKSLSDSRCFFFSNEQKKSGVSFRCSQVSLGLNYSKNAWKWLNHAIETNKLPWVIADGFVCLLFVFVCLFVCLFVRLFVCIFVCLFVCLFVCSFGWLFVSLLVSWSVTGVAPRSNNWTQANARAPVLIKND